ncbi:acyl-CoA/acyl-ACP dehydrogenase [Pseudomonas sp. KNUC1026]|nr:acyl-CoA dehydrogenase family protein [Pseudomonas sp. KNUC1026]UFH50306.1 acyl-CoA/acyl-ACP dehydrogenase [Pseudomonas sp. KNUC1026]
MPAPPANPLDPDFLAQLTAALAEHAERYDRSGEFPADCIALLRERGLLALTVPQAFGGGGASLATARQVVSAVAQGEPSTALILLMQYIQHARLHHSPRWPAHWKQRLALDAVETGALLNALRVEPDLGSPARGGLPATIARRTPEGWRLSGRKIYSTGSHGLSWLQVWARSDDPDPLVGNWLVRNGSPGIRIEPTWDHLGMRATCSHDMVFEDVLVPLDQAVSVSPASAPHAEFDNEDQLWMAVLLSSLYDGIARAARDDFRRWLKARVPANLGAPLATLPRFQERLGQIESLLLANQALLDSAAEGRVSPAQAPAIKYLATRTAIEAVSLAIEAGGNPALDRRNALERHYRNVLCGRIHTPQDDSALIAMGKLSLAG